MWLVEDGILRVYAEQTDLSCYRVVVDCTDLKPGLIPGEVDGYPVRIRVAPEEPADQKAARLFAQRAMSSGYSLRPVTTPSGQVSILIPSASDQSTSVLIEGTQVSKDLEQHARQIAVDTGTKLSSDLDQGSRPMGRDPARIVRFTS